MKRMNTEVMTEMQIPGEQAEFTNHSFTRKQDKMGSFMERGSHSHNTEYFCIVGIYHILETL